MSEFQYVAFQAIDKPLSDEQLKFMQTQSSRAEISRWSFTNEYHYGDFRGDVAKMLCSGYDVHLHYANYGTRRVALRLPGGLPFDKELWVQYCEDEEGFGWKPDDDGSAGIVDWSPFHDGGTIDEEWEPHTYLNDCIALRHRLIQGDLRALYLIWLCTANGDYSDGSVIEPPVPYGLAEFVEICGDLLGFFGVDSLILQAASQVTPALERDPVQNSNAAIARWVAGSKLADARQWLNRFLTEDAMGVKAELLAEIRSEQPAAAWPSVPGTRTFEQLSEITEELRAQENAAAKIKQAAKAKLDAEKAEQQRRERMQKMKTAPDEWLARASKLVEGRGTANYREAADILADLREAIGGSEGAALAKKHAALLCKKHPTLTQLKGSLRKGNLMD